MNEQIQNTMSNKLTYIEARDKIWSAYFRDEIEPYDCEFCFCGNLAGSFNWFVNTFYTPSQYNNMEAALFDGMEAIVPLIHNIPSIREVKQHPQYEDAVFNGMIKALEVLKSIHKGRGDFIPEDEPLLTKRNLEHA